MGIEAFTKISRARGRASFILFILFGKVTLRLSIMLLLVVLVTACDSMYGPGLVNRTTRVVKFTASFSGNHQEFELKPNQAYVQGHPNVKLEALTVKDGDLRREFTPAELAAALSESKPKRRDPSIIEYLDDGRLQGTTWRQLHK